MGMSAKRTVALAHAHTIQCLRKTASQRGLKQADLARELGIRQSQVSRLYSGRTVLTSTLAARIERFLGPVGTTLGSFNDVFALAATVRDAGRSHSSVGIIESNFSQTVTLYQFQHGCASPELTDCLANGFLAYAPIAADSTSDEAFRSVSLPLLESAYRLLSRQSLSDALYIDLSRTMGNAYRLASRVSDAIPLLHNAHRRAVHLTDPTLMVSTGIPLVRALALYGKTSQGLQALSQFSAYLRHPAFRPTPFVNDFAVREVALRIAGHYSSESTLPGFLNELIDERSASPRGVASQWRAIERITALENAVRRGYVPSLRTVRETGEPAERLRLPKQLGRLVALLDRLGMHHDLFADERDRLNALAMAPFAPVVH